MTGSREPPSVDGVRERVRGGDAEATRESLAAVADADVEHRKRTLQALRDAADEDSSALVAATAELERFLADDERAVRLSAAKLFAALAEADPGGVRPAVDALAARVGDASAFYYVRARAAEALGYVALEHPDAVSDPETLAELRVGLEFEEPELREKLAKALAGVALGDPSRLRHRTGGLGAHLDDEATLVRYHLATALAAVGCEHPAALADAVDALEARLADDCPQVAGRAAEALGLLAGADDAAATRDAVALDPDAVGEYDAAFAVDRVAFLRRAVDGTGTGAGEGVGTLAGIRDGTEAAVDDVVAPGGDRECPQCGVGVPPAEPPVCPQCGAPF